MMKKRIIGMLLAVCCCAALTGCVREKKEELPPAPTLAPAGSPYKAPDGDETVGQGRESLIYLPAKNGLHLVPRTVRLEAADLIDTAEALIQRLLKFEGDDQAEHPGGERQLTLYGNHPIEISGGVCTVNFSASALELDHSEFYRTALALSTTLCALEEISYVNVLVNDQSVGMDITGNLAMGSLIGHPEENLPVLWEQMEAKRAPLGSNLSEAPMSALATLYYPLREARGIGCATRLVTFQGQTPQQLAANLLAELSAVKADMSGTPELPRISDFLLHEPLTSELEDGGRLITISFRENIESQLALWETDLACLVAAVTTTLTTFIPGVAAVCVRMGDKPITGLNSARFATITTLGGLVRRSMLEPYLMGSALVFFGQGGALRECEQPVKRNVADSPRAQLCALMEGPDEREQKEGMTATLPATLGEEDILGIIAQGDTLLVNLSERFRAAIREAGAEKEMLLCYSIVNTLCLNTGMKRVRFFFEGEVAESIAGQLYWAGEFLYNTGLSEQGLG